MTQEKCYKANPDVSCRDEGDDGGLLYDPDTNDSVLINPSGLLLWSFLESPRTLPELTQHLVKELGAPTEEQANQDATEFIEGLLPDFVVEIQ